MANNAKLEGLPELNRTLENLAEFLGPDKVEPLLFESAEFVANKIESNAPLGPTGNLKRSIIAKRMPRTANRIAPSIAAVDRRIAPHAGLVEFGSSRAPAQPYFRPGWDTSRGQAKKMITKGLIKLIVRGARS